KKVINHQMNSSAGKFGKQVSNTAPLKGIRDSARHYTSTKNSGKDASVFKSIKQGHMKKGANGQMEYNAGKIAGTVATVGVAGRIATGGGLYRDQYGNVNLPGIPFI
ncbi:MAG: hypothetical protein ACRCX8_03145, partial [Sarcina sp.]